MTSEIIEVNISEIQVLEELYPRDEINQEHVNLYRLNLEKLPPINISKDYILIDGAHRLKAHVIEQKTRINAIIENIEKDQVLLEAIKRNAKHGKQLDYSEKERLIPIIYQDLFEKNGKNGLIKEIAELFAVTERFVEFQTKEFRDEEDDKVVNQIISHHLQCKTSVEISELLNIPDRTIRHKLRNGKKRIYSEIAKPDSLQVSDVWRFSSKDKRYGTSDYPGSIPGQVVENFLYYFTEPFDIVVDPMAGGGTTVDVCKKMYRRYRAYDINPMPPEIKFNDITKGYPPECKVLKSPDAIYLDPPYWFTMGYTDKSVDKYSRDDFLHFIDQIAQFSFETVKTGGVVAFICQDIVKPFPNLYKADTDKVTSMIHYAPLFEQAGFELEWRVHVPLTLAQYNAMKTAYAQENKIMLNCVRDLLVWRKP